MMITLNGNMPTSLDDFYNPMADNYVVPKSVVTEKIWNEIIEIISHPYADIDGGYCLITCLNDDRDASGGFYTEECWCVTSWLE